MFRSNNRRILLLKALLLALFYCSKL